MFNQIIIIINMITTLVIVDSLIVNFHTKDLNPFKKENLTSQLARVNALIDLVMLDIIVVNYSFKDSLVVNLVIVTIKEDIPMIDYAKAVKEDNRVIMVTLIMSTRYC